MDLESERAEKKEQRPERREEFEWKTDDVNPAEKDLHINFFVLSNKSHQINVSEAKRTPDAYAIIHPYDDFYYIKNIHVNPDYQGMGYGGDLFEKINEFFDNQEKIGLGYSIIPTHSDAAGVHKKHGWQPVVNFPPWVMHVPQGVKPPSVEGSLKMILKARPDYAEYLPSLYSRGVTLIDTIVGTGLLVLVFVGITAAFQLSVDIVTNNKARAGAIALANDRQEYIRSLPYDSVGTVGGIPAGSIAQTEATALNGIAYTRRTIVLYADDPKDGAGGLDANSNIADYKVAKTEVSWVARQGGLRKVSLTTRISPIGVEQSVPGGTLALSILDAGSLPVRDAQVVIVNTTTAPAINLPLYSDEDGLVTIIGAPPSAGYKITVTKSGYSSAQTYDASAENTNPTPGHLTVALNQTTSFPFFIDLVSVKNIQTYSPIATATTTDTFLDSSQLADVSNVEVSGGSLALAGNAPYMAPGAAWSVAITPSYLVAWKLFTWDDALPAQTNILYRVYDSSRTSLIPDGMLPGNSAGFSAPPINISGISTTSYPSVSLSATLGTADENETPEINSWGISYDRGPIPLPNIPFGLQGNKSIGNGPGGTIYKYATTTLSTGEMGAIGVGNLEYDTYTTSVSASSGYDIASSCGPQPEGLAPDSYATTRLILAPHTTNSLLVDVRGSGNLISNASVRLYRTPGFDETFFTDSCGQAFFGGLSVGSQGGGNPYSIDVTAAGYPPYTASDVNVSGTSRLSVVLN